MKSRIECFFAAVAALTALAVWSPPRERQRVIAQSRDSTPILRLWRCLTIAGSTLGTAAIDSPCDLSMPRPSSLHLAPTRAAASVRAMLPPNPPGRVTASVSAHRVTLSWVPPDAGNPPDSYLLEAGSASGQSDLVHTDVGSDASTLILIDVPSGSHFARVRARTSGGTSPASNEVLVTVAGDSCAGVPGAPSGLSSTVSGTTVTLAWQAPSGGCAPTAYTMEAGSASGLSNLASFSTGNTITGFTASGVASGTYYVRIRSTNASGTSGASNEAHVVVGGGGCQGAPAPPTRPLYGTNGTTVTVYWEASASPTLSYIIEAGSASGLTNLAVLDTGSAAISFTATAAVGTYYLRVRTRNGCGVSTPSSELVVAIDGTPSESVSIFVSDLMGQRLVSVTDLAGGNWATGPTVSGLSFNYPWHIALDARRRIYVADRDNNRIVRMDDLSGNGWKAFSGVGINRLANPGCEGPTVPPVGCVISVNVDALGRIYVNASGRIVRIDDMDGNGWTSFGGTQGTPGTPGFFNNPKVLFFDPQGRMVVSDTDYHRIDRFEDMQGTGWITFGSKGNGVGQFNRPEGLAVDKLGRIYITDNENSRIVRVNDVTGAGWSAYGAFGTGVGQFDVPHDIAVSDSLHIYVIDTGNGRIVRLDDMSGTGWATFGKHTVQPPSCTTGNCVPPGFFEFIAPKGIKVLAR